MTTRTHWIRYGQLVSVALVLFVSIVGCGAKHREFFVDDDTYFYARFDGSDAEYYSVRATKTDDPTGTLNPNLVFHWKQVEYKIADITPDDVQKMGGKLIVPEALTLPHKVQHGFLGFGPQNRHGGVEFDFDDGRITKFYARWHRESECPFMLSSVGGTLFQFPATEEVLIKAFGDPKRISDMTRH